MTVYNDPSVKWGGQPVGGIRVSHLSHIDSDITIPLTVTRGQKKQFTVKKLIVQEQQNQQQGSPDVGAVVEAISKATDAALGGTDAFRKWFNGDEAKRIRHLFKDDVAEMDKLKKVCAEADDAGEDEPFGEGP